MSVELVQFVSQLMNLVMFIQIFTNVKFAENKHSWQREDVSFFAELINTSHVNIMADWAVLNQSATNNEKEEGDLP
jgi:hypothetical protein